MEYKSWIGVDLDGTLAEYTEWISPRHIGKPIKPMVELVKAWVKSGKNVKIFTARVSPVAAKNNGISLYQLKPVIQRWLRRNLGFELPITHEKDHMMVALWDDMNLVKVEKNKGVPDYGWILCESRLPKLDSDDYYQNRYSEPVLVKNEITGQIAHAFYRYDHHKDGWVEDSFSEGPDPENYEIQFVTHWKIAV